MTLDVDVLGELMQGLLNRNWIFSKHFAEGIPRLVWLTAPAGYGKTMLAAQLASWSEATIIWQDIDPWQRDLKQFLEKASSLWLSTIPKLPEEFFNPSLPPQQLAHKLCSFLKAESQNKFLYILDDVHHLQGIIRIEQYLNALVEYLPPNAHIVLVGRDGPRLSWSQFHAHGWLSVLNREDLSFQAGEIQELSGFEVEEAQKLQLRYAGWIACIRIAIQLHSEQGVLSQVTGGIEQADSLFKILVEAYFEQQAPDFQYFLMQSALAQAFSPKLCIDALQIDSFDSHLENLFQDYFFVRIQQNRYVYHELFRDYLRQRFKREQPEIYKESQKRLALWYQAADQAEEAIWHYIQAEVFEAATELAERLAREFHITGRWESLLRLQEWLSDKMAPRLHLLASQAQMDLQRYTEAIQTVSLAQKQYREQGNVEAQYRCRLLLATIYSRQGRYQETLEELASILAQDSLPQELAEWALRTKAWACMELGRIEEAITYFEEVLQGYSDLSRNHGRSHVLQDLGIAYLKSGNLEAAGKCLQELMSLRRQSENLQDLALALNDLGYYYHCCSDYADAEACFEEAMALLAGSDGRASLFLQWSYADLLRDTGRYPEAEALYLQALRQASSEQNPLQSTLLLNMAQLRLWQDRGQDASILLKESLRLETGENSLQLQVIQFLCAYLDYQHGKEAGTLIKMQEALDKLVLARSAVHLAQCLGYYIALVYEIGDQSLIALAHDYLKQLPEKLVQPLAACIVHLKNLLPLAKEKKYFQHKELAKVVEKIHNILENRPRLSIHKNSAYQLRLELLGKELITLDGKDVPATAWKVRTARELFFYLCMKGPQRKETLILAFWPEHNPHQVRNALHNTLKRLRQAIPRGVVCQEELYQLNPDYEIGLDSQQFLMHLRRAEELPRHDVRAEEQYRWAYQLYQGILLPDFDSDWIVHEREKLQAAFIDVLLGLANCAMVQNNFLRAMAYYEQAIGLEPYDEKLYRLLMLCQSKAGQRSAVQFVFESMTERFAHELNISPSQETWNFFYQMLN